MRLGERISGEEFLDAAFRDDTGGIVIRMIRVSAALTDKFGWTLPIVRGSECADRTFLRAVLGRDPARCHLSPGVRLVAFLIDPCA